MKSQTPNVNISITALLDRLIQAVVLKLNNGEATERSLARLMGVSQPQMHNVLKGKRRLQPELADRLLKEFNLKIVDLLCAPAGVDAGDSLQPDTAPGLVPRRPPASASNRQSSAASLTRWRGGRFLA
jgi:transcriptional regulator with XRE-family HTH domain